MAGSDKRDTERDDAAGEMPAGAMTDEAGSGEVLDEMPSGEMRHQADMTADAERRQDVEPEG